MGTSIIIPGSDFSSVAVASGNLFDSSKVRRNVAVYSLGDNQAATIKTYYGFCSICNIEIPEGATKIRVSGITTVGVVRYRFATTTNDSESTTQSKAFANGATPDNTYTINVPSDTTYKYLSISIYRGTKVTDEPKSSDKAAAEAYANSADLSGTIIEAEF